MVVDIAAVADAVLAPFYEPIGAQGVAYGLLGLRTARQIVSFVREVYDGYTE